MGSTEPIRLVIWDLDETLWHGTLSEGGIRIRPEVHAIVVELARRGIISSICSKNDAEPVRRVLQDAGMWEYFVFPSIDWTPKGPRIARLIEAIQLRAPTVLLIDDNALNLAEAAHFSPGLQTASDAIIPSLLGDARFAGKPDTAMTRLAQYRLLEQRQAGIAAANNDNTAFLRESRITVTIEHDLEPHLDRIVELINRTNQLNFCKNRLPEDPAAARAALRAMLAPHQAQAGLLRVQDRYGDYGYCGFYLMNKHHTRRAVLTQFCFSCRILNMGVETWLYRKLNRPVLKIVGEVAADPLGDTSTIDWIERDHASVLPGSGGKQRFDHVVMRGGCELQPLAHYLAGIAEHFHDELNVTRRGLLPTISHSIMARHALAGISAEACLAAEPFGYIEADFRSAIASTGAGQRALWVFGFAHDSTTSLYRTKRTGELIPLNLVRVPQPKRNLLDRTIDEKHAPGELIDHLREHFDFHGPISDAMFAGTLAMLFERAPVGVHIVIILGNERVAASDGTPARAHAAIARNQLIRGAAAGRANVHVFSPSDYVPADVPPTLGHHFDRAVHFELFKDILRRTTPAAAVSPSA